MESELIQYRGFDLLSIRADSAQELDEVSGDLIRAELPADPKQDKLMRDRGFVFGDRTIGVTINLKRSKMDYEKLVRFDMRELSNEVDRGKVLQIAKESFPSDRRFHIRPELDDQTAAVVLDQWVRELNNTFLCISKGNVAGFIDLEEIDSNACFIHLAAVEKKYRAAGVAMSMYAYAITYAMSKGYSKVKGRISSTNTAVMNLYAYLGGSFGEPIDVYLREG